MSIVSLVRLARPARHARPARLFWTAESQNCKIIELQNYIPLPPSKGEFNLRSEPCALCYVLNRKSAQFHNKKTGQQATSTQKHAAFLPLAPSRPPALSLTVIWTLIEIFTCPTRYKSMDYFFRKIKSLKKTCLFVMILVALLVIPYSCAPRYYSDYQGQVTKGYKKPPKRWKEPKSRYKKTRIPRKERKMMEQWIMQLCNYAIIQVCFFESDGSQGPSEFSLWHSA